MTSCPIVLRDRVLQTFIAAGIQRFVAVPLERSADDPGWTRAEPSPAYWGIYSTIGLEADAKPRSESPVRIDGPESAERARRRFIPLPDSWNGADLFLIKKNGMTRNPITKELKPSFYYSYGCTERVVHLAHEHKWTGFSFAPIDKRTDLRWSVNHLVKKWPPESWHPPSPGEGKTFEEWLAIANDPGQGWMERRAAGLAIRYDFSDLAADYFVEVFKNASPNDRLTSAQWIGTLENLVGTYQFPPDVLAEAKALVQADLDRKHPNTPKH